MSTPDPDLPGDETFRALPPGVDQVVPVRCADCPTNGGRCSTCGGPRPAIALAMTIPATDQAALHHNRIRYSHLAALRLGLPNQYRESMYR